MNLGEGRQDWSKKGSKKQESSGHPDPNPSLAASRPSCVTLGKLLNLSEPHRSNAIQVLTL